MVSSSYTAERADYPVVRRVTRVRWLLLAMGGALLLFVLRGWLPFDVALFTAVALVAVAGFAPLAGRQRLILKPALHEPAASLEAELQNLVEALPESCLLLTPNGTIRYANRQAREAFGAVRVGEPLALTLRVPEVLDAVARIGAGGAAEACTFTERVPTERLYLAHVAPLRRALEPGRDHDAMSLDAFDMADRRADLIVLFIRDLTENMRVERMRADFVANASHELRTPLASLTGFIETLQGPARMDAEAQERFLPVMHNQALRMGRLIDDLLSLSRIEMKAHVQPLDLVNIVDVVTTVIDGLAPMARVADVTVTFNRPQSDVFVRGDFDELTQVFENLIENAIKYGASGKRVVIDIDIEAPARDDDAMGRDAVSVRVHDFGLGIAEDDLPRLTERFYRAHEQDETGAKGTGLGLAIVKHIVNRHRGRLRIESRLGTGSQFSVTLDTISVKTPKGV